MSNGRQYQDDKEIQDGADLWRIPPDQWKFDENIGRVRPTSGSLSDSSESSGGTPMSVDVADLVYRLGKDHRSHTLANNPDHLLASFTAGIARQHGQGIHPEEDQGNVAHAFVFGHKTDSIKKKMARASTWIVGPPAQ